MRSFFMCKAVSNPEAPSLHYKLCNPEQGADLLVDNVSLQGVQHLGPATDFYKKLALDCSGQQIGVDLFLLSSQYADLASLGNNTSVWFAWKAMTKFPFGITIRLFSTPTVLYFN